MIRQGEIYYADLPEAGRRPVLVVSREELNRGRYVVIVPFTSARLGQRRALPSCVFFQAGQHGVTTDCVAQCEAAASAAVDDLDADAGPIGTIDETSLRDVVRALGHVIEAECEPS